MRTKSQNGRRSRTKGHAWERAVANMLKPIFPGAERCIAQSRTAKREGCDVEGTPYWIECKVGAVVNPASALIQARADSDGRPVVVVAKQDRRQPVAYGFLSDLTGERREAWRSMLVTIELDEWVVTVQMVHREDR